MKFRWKIAQNQEDRIKQILRDERVGITGNKALSCRKGEWTRADSNPGPSRHKGPQQSLQGLSLPKCPRSRGELHTSYHSSLALNFITLFCKKAELCSSWHHSYWHSFSAPKGHFSFHLCHKGVVFFFLIHENVMIFYLLQVLPDLVHKWNHKLNPP